MQISTNILAFIFVLSFLIFFHEFGHFLVARLFKFPIEVFSIGFGKRLFGFKRNGTDYRISLVPLGGYVKIVGLGPDETDVVAGEAPPAMRGTRWQRFLVFLAGPAVNLVLALLLTAGAFTIGREVPKYLGELPVVTVVDPGSPAEDAGIRSGRGHDDELARTLERVDAHGGGHQPFRGGSERVPGADDLVHARNERRDRIPHATRGVDAQSGGGGADTLSAARQTYRCLCERGRGGRCPMVSCPNRSL